MHVAEWQHKNERVVVLRLWSIGIGRDHNRDGQPNVHEMQDKDAAPCAANRELKRAVELGREEKWRKRRRHALLIVLAAVRRDCRANAVGFRPCVCEALLYNRQGSRLRFRFSSLLDGGARGWNGSGGASAEAYRESSTSSPESLDSG